MKKITIFIGSSINECRNERLELTNFIRSVSDGLEERYEVKLVPVVCEEVDPCMRSVRKQEEYNEIIRKSDMSFFIFFTKAGKYTIEEFETAYDQIKKSEASDKEGRPKIYVYRKNLPAGVSADESLNEFLKRVDKECGHYYGAFDHVDTVKLRVLLNVKMQEMQFLNVDVSEGKCRVDGKEVLDLKKVAEFANSGELRRLRTELEQTEEKYFRMKPEYASGKSDAAFYREYAAVAARRQELLETIETLEKSIFELSLHLSEDEVRGKITQRMKEAYRKLEAGDIEGCLAIVNPDEIIDEFTRWEKKQIEEAKRRAYYCLREVEIYIEALKTAYSYPDRFAEIRNSYEKILPIAKNYGIEEEILYAYAAFLYDQRDFEKALKLLEELLAVYDEAEEVDKYKLAMVMHLLAMVYSGSSRYDEAEKLYFKALEFYLCCSKENPAVYEIDLADLYGSLADLYSDIGKRERAAEFYLNALDIYERRPVKNLAEYGQNCARICNNIAVLYKKMNRLDDAERYYLCALEIYERLAEIDAWAYDEGLATSYCNFANLLSDTGQYSEAEKYYLCSLDIRKKLAKVMPTEYEFVLAQSCNNLATLYSVTKQWEKAEKYYLYGLEIFEQSEAETHSLQEMKVAGWCSNLAHLYYNTDQIKKAKTYFSRALDIYQRLETTKNLSCEKELAEAHIDMYFCCVDLDENSEAYVHSAKAVELYADLTKNDPEIYESSLGYSYFIHWLICGEIGKVAELNEYGLMAFLISGKYKNTDEKCRRAYQALKEFFPDFEDDE